MNTKPYIYIVTNSYPEEKVMFSTYEFEFVMENYSNFKILSFSNFKNKKDHNENIIYLSLFDGIKELLLPKNMKSMAIHFSMFKYLKSRKIIEFGKNIHSYFLALSILRNVDINDEDALFSYWLTRSTLIAFYLNKLRDINYICQGHGSDIYIYPPEKIKDILDNSKWILTVADNNKHYLCKQYKISEEKVKVFRLGVSDDFYSQIQLGKENKLVKKSNEKIRFLTVARYETVKGIDLLLEAINQLVLTEQISKNVEFAIFGDGSKLDDYQTYIEKNNLQDYVIINGWIDRKELVFELLKADCYVLPSRSEGLPVVLMEACATALPIIATNVGSVCEIAKNGYNAILCKEVNATSLSESIQKFLSFDDQNIKKLSSNSSEIFKKNYDLEKNLKEKYDYIQNNLVGKKSSFNNS
ncbi:hypothetical protein ASG99_07705 [Bacillus sp. Soil768D1]|nr:hypothetical protein ASG99_07705 [Bacillus sp. Soil768D1]